MHNGNACLLILGCAQVVAAQAKRRDLNFGLAESL
jgi:hypothetical protein